MPRSAFPIARASALGAFALSVAVCGGEIGEPLGKEGAHEHGVADLSVVVDGASATVVFSAPAGDLWGFEHEAETGEEVEARAEALALLEDRLVDALGLDSQLGCQVVEVLWTGAAGGTVDHADADHDHADDDHAHDEHEEDPPHDHEQESDQEGAEEDHDHEHHDGSSDAVGEFSVECREPLSGSSLRLGFSEVFEALERIDLQVVSEDRQLGRRVSAQDTEVGL